MVPRGVSGPAPSPDRFAALCRRLGAAADASSLAADLLARYREPRRAYHGLDHLRDCLEQLDTAPPEGSDRDRVEAALWFHDAIYDPLAGDNEARSAELARRSLEGLGVAAAAARQVAELVLETRHLEPPADPDARLLCDVDLSVLGREPAVFERYERGIRTEYALVPEALYRRERAAVLRRLLQRRPLFATRHFRRRYEQAARANLARALAACGG
jgi:predicted metal-dependent HD superfamily phosphohydrolase